VATRSRISVEDSGAVGRATLGLDWRGIEWDRLAYRSVSGGRVFKT